MKRIFAALGAVGVILGAFGAHALKNSLTIESQNNWKTATLYLFCHVLAGLYALSFCHKKRSAYSFFVGICFFSGSLYLMILTHLKYLGYLTPIGGSALILGWIFLMIDLSEKKIN